jgi:AraC-like DNA-binding protein
MPWYGLVKCELRDGLWPVLPDCAFWIPANCSHRSFVSEQAKFCLLYLDEKSEVLPNVSCFVTLTPLVREMVWHMANVRPDYESASADGKIATALIGQLACMEVGHFSVSMPNNPRLRQIAECLLQDPASRRTVGEWANIIATSEKTLGRLVRRETGMSFVQWRQQLQLVVAIQMLKGGSTVQQVADALGYASTNAFGTMFKNIVGNLPAITPFLVVASGDAWQKALRMSGGSLTDLGQKVEKAPFPYRKSECRMKRNSVATSFCPDREFICPNPVGYSLCTASMIVHRSYWLDLRCFFTLLISRRVV